MSRNATIKFDGVEKRLDEICDLLLMPVFLERTPTKKTHRLFEFCLAQFKTIQPSGLDFKYANIMLMYTNILLEKFLFEKSQEVSTVCYKLLTRVDFENHIKNDGNRMNYYNCWTRYVLSRLGVDRDQKKGRLLYKEVVDHIENHASCFDDQIKGKTACLAYVYFQMGMSETALSPMPTPLGQSYFSKAIQLYRICGDEDAALHCLYKQALWIYENVCGLVEFQKMVKEKNMGNEEVVKMMQESISRDAHVSPGYAEELKKGTANTEILKNLPQQIQTELSTAYKMISDCCDNYTRAPSDVVVLLNMKHTKAKILSLMENREVEAYNLNEKVIREAIVKIGTEHVFIHGYLILKATILEKRGKEYYGIAMDCMKEMSRYFQVHGRMSESEQCKFNMAHMVKELEDSNFDTSKFKKGHALPFKSCSFLHCSNRETRPSQFKTCSTCRGRFYCSRKCQVKDWKSGHKKACTPWKTKIDEKVIEEEEKDQKNLMNQLLEGMDEDLLESQEINKEVKGGKEEGDD